MIKTGFELQIIAPDHGPILRRESDIHSALNRYTAWSAQNPTMKAVLVYDTMWESTALMARAIGEGLQDNGASIKILPLGSAHRSDVATEILEAGALVVGSPTLNNSLFPTVADVLTYLKGLRPKNLVGAAFGSYGWSGEGTREIEKILREMKVEIAGETVNVQYVPDKDDLRNCYKLGKIIADKLKDKL
ncbi:Rubredoxin-oxygen oxidoreductase [subsurface metagenome]